MHLACSAVHACRYQKLKPVGFDKANWEFISYSECWMFGRTWRASQHQQMSAEPKASLVRLSASFDVVRLVKAHRHSAHLLVLGLRSAVWPRRGKCGVRFALSLSLSFSPSSLSHSTNIALVIDSPFDTQDRMR